MRPAMSEVADVALAFARECLGWEDAHFHDHPDIRQIITDSGEPSFLIVKRFRYSDLNPVMEAVQKWCKEHSCHWGLVGNSRNGTIEYLSYVLPHDDYWEGRCESAENPCHAL